MRVARGQLHRLHRGVYAVGHPNVPLQGRFLAAVKACGEGAVLSHLCAAVLWGLLDWAEREIDVTVPGTAPHEHVGLRVHRSAVLLPVDATRHEGVPVTSPAQTLIDAAAVLPYRGLRRATGQALALGRTSAGELGAAVGRHRGRRGVARLARIVAAGPAPTRSELEDVVLDLIRRGGIARPDVNRPIVVGGRRVVPDFRWPEQRLVLEADGAAWHDHALAREDDAERQALLEAHGERVLRATWRQAVVEPERTLARLRAAGAPAG